MINDRIVVTEEDLDISFCSDAILSTEDKILASLFKEKGSTKGELVKEVKNGSFMDISETVSRMENKGLVVERIYDDIKYYYLTLYGANEVEYRLNSDIYFKLFDFLADQGYDKHNVTGFLRNRFYRFYIEGKWDFYTLVDQYVLWCESNGLTPTSPVTRKLK